VRVRVRARGEGEGEGEGEKEGEGGGEGELDLGHAVKVQPAPTTQVADHVLQRSLQRLRRLRRRGLARVRDGVDGVDEVGVHLAVAQLALVLLLHLLALELRVGLLDDGHDLDDGAG
jgi:hypothetical protein